MLKWLRLMQNEQLMAIIIKNLTIKEHDIPGNLI